MVIKDTWGVSIQSDSYHLQWGVQNSPTYIPHIFDRCCPWHLNTVNNNITKVLCRELTTVGSYWVANLTVL